MNKLGMIKTLTIASLSVLVLVVSVALAQTQQTGQPNGKDNVRGMRGEGHGDRWGGRGEHEGMRGMMFRGLNLTDDQKTKLKQISESYRERTQSLRQELRAKRQELRQANEGSSFNESVASQKLQESASLQAKLMSEEFKLHQEMLSVLTPEQKTQLEQKRAEFKNGRADREHRKGERNQPKEQ